MPPPRPQTSPKTSTEELAIQRRAAGFRLDEAPRMGDIGEYVAKRGSSQLVIVLGFCDFSLYVGFASLN